MNRIDRLFAILLVLQQRQLVRAEDLARRFGTSKRTVYRDVAALSEMGVPVVSLPGEGYSLMAGYFLPPLVFTPDEAAALFLGAELLASQATGRIVDHAEQGLAKIAHILPAETRRSVEQITQIIQFHLPKKSFTLDDRKLLDLQKAILERRAVRIVYTSYQAEGTTERVIEPQHLTYAEGAWYISGHCRLRHGPRSFRLNRIERYELLRERFTLRPPSPQEQEQIRVKVRFAPELRRWVEERQHYAFAGCEGNEALYLVHDLREIQSWLFGWGAAAEVLEPEELRHALRAEAQKLIELLT